MLPLIITNEKWQDLFKKNMRNCQRCWDDCDNIIDALCPIDISSDTSNGI